MRCVIILHFVDGTTKSHTLESFQEGSIFLGLCQHGILHNGVRHELLDHYFDAETATVHAKLGTKEQVETKLREDSRALRKVMLDELFTEEHGDGPQLELPFNPGNKFKGGGGSGALN